MGNGYGAFFTVLLVLGCSLSGCANDNLGTSQPSTPVVGPPEAPEGYFTGRVDVVSGATSDGTFVGEALITKDGLIRVNDLGGTGAQFSGAGLLIADRFVGSGILIGEVCDGVLRPLCGQVVPATITLEATTRSRLRGEILAVSEPVTAIDLDMGWHEFSRRYYQQPAALDRVSGIYGAGIPVPADSALNDMIVTIADDGQVFAQSAATGCAASGSLIPHLDAAVGVYDVSLAFAGCAGVYVALNSEMVGLATSSCQVPEFDFDPAGERLAIWVNTVDDTRPLVSMTLWAWRLGAPGSSSPAVGGPSSFDTRC